MNNKLAMIGRMYMEERRLREWLGRIATSSGYTSRDLQSMASQALTGEPSDAAPNLRPMPPS